MCSERLRRLLAAGGMLGAALALGARPARAQNQAEYRARVQALVPLWKEQIAEVARQDSVKIRALPVDTVRVDPLVILAAPEDATLAREAAEAAVPRLRARFGQGVADLRAHPFTIRTPTYSHRSDPLVEIAEVDSADHVTSGQSQPATRSLVEEAWVVRGSRYLTEELGPDFGRWLANALPVDSATSKTWIDGRIELVTTASSAAQACYAGDDRACAYALGVAGEDDPAVHWFDADERRQIVRRASYSLQRGHEDAWQRCVLHDDATTCMALARLIPSDAIQPPLGPTARQGLAQLAMDFGGPGAFARMLTAPNTVAARLQAASGIPTDSLVRVWRARIMHASAESTTMTPALALMSLFWAATCGALALRSSRWR